MMGMRILRKTSWCTKFKVCWRANGTWSSLHLLSMFSGSHSFNQIEFVTRITVVRSENVLPPKFSVVLVVGVGPRIDL